MSVENVKESIKNFFKISGENDKNLKKLEVLAQTDVGSAPEALDILNARIIETISIDLDGERRLSYEKRRYALRDAFERRQIELRRMFLPVT